MTLDTDVRNHYYMKALSEKGLIDLKEWVEQQENITDVRLVNEDTLDFTIGHFIDDWPKYTDSDTINAIRSSSIETSYDPAWSDGFEEGKFVCDGAIHLPPTYEFQKPDIESKIDISDRFFMHFGTTNDLVGFGAINDAPEGVITPHIHVVEGVTFDEIRNVIEQSIDVFESPIYDEGENVLLEKP